MDMNPWCVPPSRKKYKLRQHGIRGRTQFAVAPDTGFVWPPRPGSCSTAHWAPPASPQEIAEHQAACHARTAQIDAKIQADKLADAAERCRRDTPSLLTDDELQGQMRASRRFMFSAGGINVELSAEMSKRGLAIG
jgi:hypothetical protein